MECCDRNDIHRHSRKLSRPFVNLKIVVPNFIPVKRQLEESCLDSSYDAPHKRPRTPEALSPDLGCVMDSPVLQEGAASPIAASTPALPAKTRAFNGESKARTRLHQKRVGSGLSEEPKCSAPDKTTSKKLESLHGRKQSFMFSHTAEFYDDDVDDGILSFSPVRPDAEEGFFEDAGSHETPSGAAVRRKPGASAAVSHPEELGGERKVEAVVFRSTQECQATFHGDSTTVDTSYDATLPLQVQVKSVVTVPSTSTARKSAAAPLEVQKNQRPVRPVLLKSDAEFAKRRYVEAVMSHMNQGANPGVMNELVSLMTLVADEMSSPNGEQWQHPADLTRRNYQLRFGNVTARVPLDEWNSQNYTSVKRFAEVPKIFHRHSVS